MNEKKLVKKHERVSIEGRSDSLLISIPVIKRISIILFLVASLIVWFIGEKILISLILVMPSQDSYRLYFLLWFIAWTVVGFMIAIKLLWFIAGREVVTVSPLSIKIEKVYTGFRSGKDYSLETVKNLRMRPGFSANHHQGMIKGLFFKGYAIFDYGRKTVTFLASTKTDEAEYVLDRVMEHIRKTGK